MRVIIRDKETQDIDCLEVEGLLYEPATRELTIASTARPGIYVISDMSEVKAVELLITAYEDGKVKLIDYPAIFQEE